MKYHAACNSCGLESIHSMSALQYPAFKANGVSCDACQGGRVYPVFKPDNVRIAYKGDVWVDKNLKEREYRTQRSERLAVKQKESHFVPTLQPNYNGMEVDSWRDAQHLASTEGKDTTSYQPLVASEKKT